VSVKDKFNHAKEIGSRNPAKVVELKSNTNCYPITLRASLFYRAVPVNLTPPLNVISSNYGHSFNEINYDYSF